ncbi:MAG: TonB-dependent receptor, partial [Gammaproteobacteria bacterium]
MGRAAARRRRRLAFSPALGFRLSGLKWDRDGRIDNTKLERKEDNRDQEALRLRLEWTPADEVDVALQGQASETTVNFWPRQLMNLSDDTRAYLQAFDPQVEDDPYNFQNSYDNPGEIFKASDTLLARAAWMPAALADWGLETVLVAGVSKLEIDQFQDLDVSPADLLNLIDLEDYDQTSVEWRVGGTSGSLLGLGEQLEFLVGAYYFQSDFHIIADVLAGADIASYLATDDGQRLASGGQLPGFGIGRLGGFVPPLFSPVAGSDYYRFDYTQDTEAIALFGQLSWSLSERWLLTPGLRLNRETKRSTPTGTPVCPTAQLRCVTATMMGAEPYAPGTIERTEDNVSPKVALSYFFDDDVSVFASWTQGYKSGGVNSVSFTGEDLEYDPEEARSIELGLRSHWLERTLRLNATLYRMDFDDLQVLAFNGLFFDVTNAAAAYSEGLELDVQWLTPWDVLHVDASLGLLRARYKDYASAPAPIAEGIGAQQDLRGRTLPFAPPVSATLTPTLEIPFAWLT